MIKDRSAKSSFKKTNEGRIKLYEDDIDIRDSFDKEYTDPKVATEIFKQVHEHYMNDINAIWNRSKFFSAIDGGLIAYIFSQYFHDHGNNSKVISVVGLVISALWIWMAWFTRKWLNVWRTTLVKMEDKLVVNGPFKYGEKLGGREMYHILRPEYFSVILAVFFAFAWLYIFLLSFFQVK